MTLPNLVENTITVISVLLLYFLLKIFKTMYKFFYNNGQIFLCFHNIAMFNTDTIVLDPPHLQADICCQCYQCYCSRVKDILATAG